MKANKINLDDTAKQLQANESIISELLAREKKKESMLEIKENVCRLINKAVENTDPKDFQFNTIKTIEIEFDGYHFSCSVGIDLNENENKLIVRRVKFRSIRKLKNRRPSSEVLGTWYNFPVMQPINMASEGDRNRNESTMESIQRYVEERKKKQLKRNERKNDE